MIVDAVAFPGFDPEERLAEVQTRYIDLIANNAEASEGKLYDTAKNETKREFQRDPDGYRRKAELLQRFRSAEAARMQLGHLEEGIFWDERVLKEPASLYKDFLAWLVEYEDKQPVISMDMRLAIEDTKPEEAKDFLSGLVLSLATAEENEERTLDAIGIVAHASETNESYELSLILASFRSVIIDEHTDCGIAIEEASSEWEAWATCIGAAEIILRARDWFLEEISVPEDQPSGPPSS